MKVAGLIAALSLLRLFAKGGTAAIAAGRLEDYELILRAKCSRQRMPDFMQYAPFFLAVKAFNTLPRLGTCGDCNFSSALKCEYSSLARQLASPEQRPRVSLWAHLGWFSTHATN